MGRSESRSTSPGEFTIVNDNGCKEVRDTSSGIVSVVGVLNLVKGSIV